ncbi:MAG: phosphatase PAP2 family protein [Solirubrobacterales bacterium]
MDAFTHQIFQLDLRALESIQSVRWAPITPFFVLVSAWWVKGPILVALAAARDIGQRRRLPLAAACGAVSLALASLASGLLKELIDRSRPAVADDSIAPVVATPDSPSFPSGHTTTAFAAAVAISIVQPRLRLPMLAIAGLVGISRAYLGVHFVIDVVAGALLGAALGAGIGLGARALIRQLQRRDAVAHV